MLVLFGILVVAFQGVICSPFRHQKETYRPLHFKDYEFLNTLPRHHIGTVLPNFKYIYININSNFSTTSTRGTRGTQFVVAGSPQVSQKAIQDAANEIVKMFRFMPPSIYKKLATHAELGVFTRAEKLTIFPEFAYLANGNCGKSCTGSCKHTCTFDGRKYEDINGVSGPRTVVLDDNVMCTANDPYHHTENILAHEFTHAIQQHGINSTFNTQIVNAYNHAKKNNLWVSNSYAMANNLEYFAEGATVFMGINLSSRNTGGMAVCGSGTCNTETKGKNHLKNHDLPLYNVIAHVYTNDRPYLHIGMNICPAVVYHIG